MPRIRRPDRRLKAKEYLPDMDLTLLGVFGAGLATFVTPCVLPLVPIYLGALVGGNLSGIGSAKRGQLLVRALLFSLGFVAVFTALGLTASAFGAVIVENKSALQIAGAFLIAVFGLKFMGVIQIPAMDRVIRGDESKVQTRVGAINAVVMGVLFAAGWSPCVGPVLGSVLTYTASNAADPLVGAGWLAVYGVGFALPLLLTAVFAEAGVRFLKKINPWLPKIEKALGVGLAVVAITMIADVLPAAPAPGGASLADLVAGGEADAPAAGAAASETGPAEPTLSNGLPQDPAAPTGPAMVELYAQDCPVCQRMMPVVDQVRQDCAGRGVPVVQVDVSQAAYKHLVQQHRLVGVPTFLFLDESGSEVARLVGEQDTHTLRQHLSALTGTSCPNVGPVPGEPPAVTQEADPAEPSGVFCDPTALAHGEEGEGEAAACDAGAL